MFDPVAVVFPVDLIVELFHLFYILYIRCMHLLAFFLSIFPALYFGGSQKGFYNLTDIVKAYRITEVYESEHMYTDAVDVFNNFSPILFLIQAPINLLEWVDVFVFLEKIISFV